MPVTSPSTSTVPTITSSAEIRKPYSSRSRSLRRAFMERLRAGGRRVTRREPRVETRTVRNRKAAVLPRASGFAAVPSGDRLAGVAKSQVATHALARLRQRSVADTTGTAVVPLPLIVIRLIDSFRTTRVVRAIDTVGTIRTASPRHHGAATRSSNASGAAGGASGQDCRVSARAGCSESVGCSASSEEREFDDCVNSDERAGPRVATRCSALCSTTGASPQGRAQESGRTWPAGVVPCVRLPWLRRPRARIPPCPDVLSPAAQVSSAAI